MYFDHLKMRVGLLGGLVFSALSIVGPGHAAAMTYTNSTAFLSALPGTPSTLDFESEAAGTVVLSGDTVGGITFTFSLDGGSLDMIVSTIFETTSGINYLGVDDGDEAFLSGDGFTLSFGGTINALGLFVVASPEAVLGADFKLTAGALSVFNAGTPEVILGDDGEVFFLGLIDSNGFTSATLESFDPDLEGLFEYNIDDIVTASAPTSAIPEPGTLALFAFGVLGATAARRRIAPASA